MNPRCPTLLLVSVFVAALVMARDARGQTGIASQTSQTGDATSQKPKRLRVAVAQIPVTGDIATNVEAILRAIEQAAEEKAEILLTPEGSLSGYTHQFDQQEVEASLERIVAKASSVGLALALGTCYVQPHDGCCYNQIRFYDAHGTFLGFHGKTLRCGSMTKPPEGEINHYAASPLRTFQLNGITIGGLICNDMWANPGCTPMPDPHLSQQLAGMGAKIIFHAVNGGRDGSPWSREVYWPFHETNLRIRARTGPLWIVTGDNCHPMHIPCSAPSGVLKPDGHWAVKAADTGEQIVAYTIDLD